MAFYIDPYMINISDSRRVQVDLLNICVIEYYELFKDVLNDINLDIKKDYITNLTNIINLYNNSNINRKKIIMISDDIINEHCKILTFTMKLENYIVNKLDNNIYLKNRKQKYEDLLYNITRNIGPQNPMFVKYVKELDYEKIMNSEQYIDINQPIYLRIEEDKKNIIEEKQGSELYPCPKCNTNCIVLLKQLRSADEGVSEVVTCPKCNYNKIYHS